MVATIFSTKRNFGHTYQNLLTKCCSFTENINLTLSPPIYADGGYAAKIALESAGIPFSFTGHSLGAQKLDKLAITNKNWSDLNEKFKFSKRIAAERISMKYAAKVFVSTEQERDDQYGPPAIRRSD